VADVPGSARHGLESKELDPVQVVMVPAKRAPDFDRKRPLAILIDRL
jgi:hypothetical protein